VFLCYNFVRLFDYNKPAMNDSGNPEDKHPGSSQVAASDAAENSLPQQPATEQQLQTAEQNIEKRMSAFERSIVRLTWAAVAISILTALIFAGQLYEMISGGTQTDKLVNYAKTQANASSDQADAAQQFSDTAEDINGRMSDTVDQLESAANSAKTSIQATQNALRLDQRAWLTVKTATLEKPPAMNEKLRVSIEVTNSGKTPAIDAITASTVITRQSLSKDDFGPTTGSPPSRGVVGPNVPLLLPAESSDPFSIQGQIDALKTTHAIYVIGRVFYKDVFQGCHETDFCFRLPPEQFSKGVMVFASCETGNRVKDYPRNQCYPN
jgi:hypothetical protein